MFDPNQFITPEEVKNLAQRALPDRKILSVESIVRGSTNLLYKTKTDQGNVIIKISHRPDRIEQGILKKEIEFLNTYSQKDWGIPIPKIIWEGTSPHGYPAFIQTELTGKRVEDIISDDVDSTTAAFTLGKFLAQLHQNTAKHINEFEKGRDIFPDFSSYAHYWLKDWEELCSQAPHVRQGQIQEAYAFIKNNLHHFSEKDWPYVHADISKENLLGEVVDGKLVLTGLCDFENMQTAPMEYDIATIDDGIFLFYPHLEQPFLEGYQTITPLPQNYMERLKVVNLFRALRYIKRTVKYNEVHYYNHDKVYFEKWLYK